MLPFLVFLEGVLAFVSPCILPMLPVYLIYLAGEDTTKGKHARLYHSIGFILGFSSIFVALGALATGLGRFLASHHKLLQIVSAMIMIFLGIHYLGLIKWPWIGKAKEEKGSIRINKTGLGGVLQSYLFGLAFAVTWTPCVGTFLASALTLAAQAATLWKGVGLLLLFSLGLGLPFLIMALLYERLNKLLVWIRERQRAIKIAGGVLLILLGLALLFDLQGAYMRLFN